MFTFTNDSMVKNQNEVRAKVAEMFREFLVEKFGEENVSLVGSNEYAFVAGTVENKNGVFDMVMTVKPVAKNYEDTVRSKKVVEAYDRIAEAEAYAMEIADKAKAREVAKAERERKKAEKNAK